MQLPPTILSVDEMRRKPQTVTKPKKPETAKKTNNRSRIVKSSPAPKDLNASTQVSAPIASEGEANSLSESEASDSHEENFPEGGTDVLQKPATDRSKKGNQVKLTGLRPPRTLETTLFERLEKMYGPSIKRLLNIQYRYPLPSMYIHACVLKLCSITGCTHILLRSLQQSCTTAALPRTHRLPHTCSRTCQMPQRIMRETKRRYWALRWSSLTRRAVSIMSMSKVTEMKAVGATRMKQL